MPIVAKSEILRDVVAMIQDSGLAIRPNVAFPWITNRVPREHERDTPPRVIYRLSALHVRLGGNWAARLQKRVIPLRLDFQVGASTLIEVDTVPHFSTARLTSLGYYDDMEHNLDVDGYAALCDAHRSSADLYQYSRQPVDFPFPGGRSAQMAFFDFVKDLLAPAHGFRLIRLPAPEGIFTESMALTLRVLL